MNRFKRIVVALMSMALIPNAGCMITSSVLDKAKASSPAKEQWNSRTDSLDRIPAVPPKHGYDVLVPFAVVADVATSPFQLAGIAVFAWVWAQ